MNIAKIQYTFVDKNNKEIGNKLYAEVIEHQFIPKTKSFGTLDFKFEFASIEKENYTNELWLYVIYKEKGK